MTSRRDFCKKTILATGACALGGAFLLESCGSTALVEGYKVVNQELRVELIQLAELKHTVVKDSKLDAPIYISKQEDGLFRSFNMKCTHRGCTTRVSGNVLVCPCHGSEFSSKGEVLSSPARENLLEYKTRVEANEIIINI